MAWSEKLKLNKQLLRAVVEAGFANPKDIQQKMLARIAGGQDIIAIGPEGCGKTTTYVLAVLNRFKYNNEGVPLVLVLVPDKERVLAVIEQFEKLNKNESISIVGLYTAPGTEAQMNALADGADIVVATPDRARAIYLKLGLNLNKIELLVIDDAELIVKQGLQLPVTELANSITKCQHVVFTEVLHDKLDRMIAPFMNLPAIIEVEETTDAKLETLNQLLYHVPNFGTKLNLLNLFMQDEDVFSKCIIFVNTRQTAEKIYKSLKNRLKEAVSILNSWSIEFKTTASVDDFKAADKASALIVINENTEFIDLDDIPFIIHFELPTEKETFIERITVDEPTTDEDTIAIVFATDLELAMIKKIEQTTGQKISAGELPDGLVIDKDVKRSESAEKSATKHKPTEPITGEAFHQKKESNSKTYNYSAGAKAKMNNKKKHG